MPSPDTIPFSKALPSVSGLLLPLPAAAVAVAVLAYPAPLVFSGEM
jgi:hypothetical protein